MRTFHSIQSLTCLRRARGLGSDEKVTALRALPILQNKSSLVWVIVVRVREITWGGKAHAEKQKKSVMARDFYCDDFLVGHCLPQTGVGVLRGYPGRHRRAHRFSAGRGSGQLTTV